MWVGVLDSADFGVPQNRRRAVLIASRVAVVSPPRPTHAEHPFGLFDDLRPWVTLADALGIGRSWEYDSGQNSVVARKRVVRYRRSCDRPAGTITSKVAGQWVLSRGDERRRVSRAEAAMLQTFPSDYPWQGAAAEQSQQIGDAMPPLFAAPILTAVGAARDVSIAGVASWPGR